MGIYPLLTDSNGGIGFSGSDIISDLFFNFCLPVILFIFFLKVYIDYSQIKKLIQGIFQTLEGTITLEEEES